MKLVDLTHIITEGMPVYPGTEAPILAPANTIPVDGFQEKKITMYSHTGTHMDAPAHLVPGAATLDQLPLDTFYGRACVLDFPTKNEPLLIHEKSIVGNDFLLLRCGWDKKWGTGEYFTGYPALDVETATWLTSLGLKGIGVDVISVDPVDSSDLPNHRILLAAGIVIIENLTNLSLLPGNPFRFSCFPLRIHDADGSPVRAVAELL